MFGSIQRYLLTVLVALSVITGGASFILWKANQNLRSSLAEKEATIQQTEKNLFLVSNQLAQERETRKAVEEALSALKEVPDVDYSTPLPDSIRGVLTGFRKRMQ